MSAIRRIMVGGGAAITKLSEIATRKHHELTNYDEFDDHTQYVRGGGRGGLGQSIFGTPAVEGQILYLASYPTSVNNLTFQDTEMIASGTFRVSGNLKTSEVDAESLRASKAIYRTMSTDLELVEEQKEEISLPLPAPITRVKAFEACTIRGVKKPAITTQAQERLIYNVGVPELTFTNEDAGAPAEQRMILPAEIKLKQNEHLWLIWDYKSKRWRNA